MRVPCPQCGGEVRLRDAEGFPACPFCGVGLAFDLTGVRPHLLYRPRLTPDQLLPALRRWADRQGCQVAATAAPRLAYYPFWRYAQEGPLRLVPAWPTLEPAWERLPPPEAEQAFFDPAQVGEARLVEASVPEAAARARVGAGREGELVHLPVYEGTVRAGGGSLSVWVEACGGGVIWPEAAPPAARGRSGRAVWMLGGGLAMLCAAALIRPLPILLPLLVAAAALIYVGLLGTGRG